MDEAEVLCDRILIVDKGKIIEEGKPRRTHKKTHWRRCSGVRL